MLRNDKSYIIGVYIRTVWDEGNLGEGAGPESTGSVPGRIRYDVIPPHGHLLIRSMVLKLLQVRFDKEREEKGENVDQACSHLLASA